jgi:hypothetical protein
MATRIIEYGGLVGYLPGVVPASQKVTEQAAMTATGTSAKSAAFNAGTELVCVQSDEAIKVAFGPDATVAATDNSYKIPAGEEQFFAVRPGWKAAIKT